MVKNRRDLEKAFSPKVKSRRLDLRCTLGRSQSHSPVNIGTTSDVKVFIRVRPLSEKELNTNSRSTIKVVDDKMLIFDPKEKEEQFFFHGQKQKARDINKRANKELEFGFNQVFPPEATNTDVYEATTKSIITSLLDGYNCSVFVYGATGAGKTHTMLGSKNQPGITYLTMVELYNQVEQLSVSKDFSLGVSYLEVYNENVHDLLQPSSAPMHLREDANGVTVAGLNVRSIQNATQLFDLLEFGNKNRTQHPTDANAESSRSHAVFQVYIRMSSIQDVETKLVKLSMIDLAGSERGMATGCSGSRFKEGSNINKSLLALGNCINNLAAGLKHIPYRDSKLTRLLKDSLGGNCQTLMIANVSPSALSYEDTYNTLKYATRAKKIKSRLSKNIVSVDFRIGDYVKLVAELKKEITKLKNQMKTLELASTKQTVMAAPPTPDQRFVEKMSSLFQEKKELHCKLLSLESQEKTLEWRIRHKQLIASQLGNIKAVEDIDSQGINRVQNTLRQLEARVTSIRENIKENLLLYNKHKQQFCNFKIKLEESKTGNLLKKDMMNKELEVVVAGLKIQKLHHQKIIQIQDKRIESNDSIITNMSSLNSQFHSLVKGCDLLTIDMENDYQSVVRMLEGVKGVTWTDIDEEEDDGTSVNLANVRSFMNLHTLDQKRPEVFSEETENIKTEEGNGDATGDLNSTYIAAPATENQTNLPPVPVVPNVSFVKGLNLKPQTQRAPLFKIPNLPKDVPLRNTALSKFSLKKEIYFVNKIPKISSSTTLPSKSTEPRVPLKTLKMNRINSKVDRTYHPYMTPVSRLGQSARSHRSQTSSK